MRWFFVLAALLFAPVSQAQTLAELAWLKGCWRTEAPREAESGAVVTEVWIAPPIPALLGYSYTVGEGEVQGWEQMRMEMIDGWPHFVAMPNGGPPVRFRQHDPDDVFMLEADDLAVFENPEHDFPQTVTYARFGDRLMAQIAGENYRDAVRFDYRRIRCPANLRP